MSLEVEYFLIDSTAASNYYVPLAGTPVSATNVAMDTISGTAQAINNDFGVDTTSAPATRIRWNAPYNLYNQIAAGDRVRVIYDKA